MSRTPARFTRADVARTIRAAKQAGAGRLELLPDMTIQALARAWEKVSRTPRLPELPSINGNDFPFHGEIA
jgi:hypothetical protein